MPKIGKYARIAPDVEIHPEARIKGRAAIATQDDILVIGPVHGAYFTAYRDDDIGVRVVRLCFSGTLQEYEVIYEDYCKGDTERLAACKAAVDQIRAHFDL